MILNKLNKLANDVNIKNDIMSTSFFDKSEIDVRLKYVDSRTFVYFLISANDIIYIGKSKKLYSRLKQHKGCIRNFNKVALMEFGGNEQVVKAEKYLIRKLNPEHNIQFNKNRAFNLFRGN